MATGWVKALQCKSRALEDVVVFRHNHQNRNKVHHTKQTNPKTNHHHHHHNLIPDAASCRKSVQNLKDVVETSTSAKQKQSKSRKSKPPSPQPPPCQSPAPKVTTKRSFSTKPDQFVTQQPTTTTRSQPSTSTRRSRSADSFFPALSELPEGHPSRNVVEIIFHTSWSPKAFSGRIEMVFKVQNLSRTVARFEEYRETVKSRAESAGKLVVAPEGESEGEGEDHARCVADGNEVMRFYCLGPTSGTGGGAYDTCGGGGGCGVWTFNGNKGAAICTFSGSGTAHENAGGGRGRRAMLVCRVISGRVCKELGFESLIEGRVGYDSVSGENGELLVFDSRAVLPCFLIIYKL